MNSFGDRLRGLRVARKMTQNDLVKIIREKLHSDMQRQTLGMWETGKSIPRHETLVWLATFFRVSLDYLIEGKETVSASKKIPIVGTINTLPVLSAENVIGETEVPLEMINGEGAFFQVIARDDSMAGVGLRQGYRVVIREQSSVQNGEVGLVKVGGDVLIRKVYTIKDGYLLIPSSPDFKETEVDGAQTHVLGKVIAAWFEF